MKTQKLQKALPVTTQRTLLDNPKSTAKKFDDYFVKIGPNFSS